ncbi:hypothetical protein ABMA28_012085 [Loxostege sticticalis]|uniref:LITAF domain-containing protein n=1 Tax=Loxostege sticticalis TaxID=481309 RepID=A0ABD0TLM8_LOXSC
MDNDYVPLCETAEHIAKVDLPASQLRTTVSLQPMQGVPSIMHPAPNTSASAPAANTGQLLLGPENTIVECPFCHKQIKTAVKYSSHTGTHIAAAIWGRMCCLCCIPYCSDSAKNADHYCPGCQRYLGTYRT